MAFNNQHMQPQMSGAYPDADRDEFGLTEADYEQMLNEVTVTCVDGHYEAIPAPQPSASNDALESSSYARGWVQPGSRTDQSGVSSHDGGNLSRYGDARYPQHGSYQQVVPPIESRSYPRRRVQPDSHTDQPGASNHAVGNPGSQGGARFHQHRNYQQSAPPNRVATVQSDSHTDQPRVSTYDEGNSRSQGGARYHQPGGHRPLIPPNPFATFGNTYPAPPIGWESGSDFPNEGASQDSRSNSFGGLASTSRSTPFAQHGTSRRVAAGFDARSSYAPSQYAPSPHAPSTYAPSPYAPSPYAQSSYAPSAYAPTPYADNPTYVTTHSRPQTIARPHQRRPQTQPSRRQPTVPVEHVEVEEREDPTKEEENEESGEKEELTMTTKTKKTKRASKATQEPSIGLTCVNENGELEWFATANSEGVLAVRHDDIRPQLIAIAEAERVALGVKYAHPDEPGQGRHNVTSFYRKHIHWGPEREHRPQNLFAWEEDKRENPRLECPGDMYWEEAGKKYIVLDPHDNPVKNWDLPLTIASNIPAYKLEAMRRDNMSLQHDDFRARMPSRINVGTRDEPIWKELAHKNTVINMPLERFRFRAGLCSWREREGTSKIKEGLKKLYGDKIQNKTVRAFGRDLTNNEIKEIHKGKEAKFPIEDDVVHGTRKGNKKRKRKCPAIEESVPLEEDTQTRIRPRKRARRVSEEASIASEIDDLVMQTPTIDQGDPDRRYPLRSTRNAQEVHRTVEPVEELGDQSSTHEDPHSESDEVASASQASFVETEEDDERPSPRVPFRRIPGIADVGGKCKGPSWVSSTSEEDQSNEERDHRKAVVPLNICGRVHYATYEGLISNGPLQCDGASDTVAQRQGSDIDDASLQQNESESPPPHPFDLMMKAPVFPLENTEEELTPLEAHRKRVREFLGEEEPEFQAPPSKRLCTEQQVLPLPRPATHEATISVPAQTASPPISQPQIDRNGRVPPTAHAQASKIREQKLDAEWAQVFEQTFLDIGFVSVNYSEVCPWNDEEVQSIIDALLPTREVYLAWTGEPAPRTDPHQSYRAQFDTIFVAFQDWWETHRSNEDLPILSGVVHGGRSVDDWSPPSKDSIYYEAFEKGHRAHRGGLSEYSGPRLEDASRIPY